MISGGLFVTFSGLITHALKQRRAIRTLPPIATKSPHVVQIGSRTVADDLFWLRDDNREDPKVIAHLNNENAYTKDKTKHLDGKTDLLYRELLSRVKETDSDVPYKRGNFFYYNRTEAGKSYSIHCRYSAGDPTHSEVVLLDENKLAAGNPMCDVHSVEVSPNEGLIGYSVDFSGYETYKLVILDVKTNRVVDEILETNGEFEWGEDNNHIYYMKMDSQHRPNSVWIHELGTDQKTDRLIYEETDETFWLGLSKTLTNDFIIIDSSSKITSEVHFLSSLSSKQSFALKCVQPRMTNVLYEVDHFRTLSAPAESGFFLITTNHAQAINFKIMVASVSTPSVENWIPFLQTSKSIFITHVSAYEHHLVVYGRQDGYPNIWLMKAADLDAWLQSSASNEPAYSAIPILRLPAKDEVYVIGSALGNAEFSSKKFRFSYSSPITPSCVCEIDPSDLEIPSDSKMSDNMLAVGNWSSVTVLKQKEVPNCDLSKYTSKRIFATAKDGTQIPLSLVWRKSSSSDQPSSPSPLLLYGYGSYGHSIDLNFNSSILSLVDRGLVYAVAHVRGGSELGREWYEAQGKLLTKRNTFEDFFACGQHLLDTNWARKGSLACMGASAGGLLMGVCANEASHIFNVIVSQVGFVDVLVTMSDETIPLTTTEFDEWGNPKEEPYFNYIKSYDPMQNISKKEYPKMLLTAGLNDSRVAYWEPAKFAQRLRENNTGPNDILLKVDMSAGHFSFSHRYAYLREKAWEYAWLLDSLGVAIEKQE
jgi:oligopeptidase B